jgi:uncharacterized damage-inducible protein DinB
MNTAEINTDITAFVFTTNFLDEWLGHRRLTRKVIAAFPEDKLFTYSIGGMRPFAEMVKELIDVSGPGIRGIALDNWENTGGFSEHSLSESQRSKDALLQLWDESTEEIIKYFTQISQTRLEETVLAFGQYEGQVFSTILYFKDNEVHHRAQGVVYLKSLGIEPPAFYDRY